MHGMQEVRGFDSHRLHPVDQDFCCGGRLVRGLEMDVVRDPCAISSVGVGICRRGTGHFASLATGGGAVAEQALHPLCRFGDDRSDPAAVFRRMDRPRQVVHRSFDLVGRSHCHFLSRPSRVQNVSAPT